MITNAKDVTLSQLRFVNAEIYKGKYWYGINEHGLTNRIMRLARQKGVLKGKSLHTGKWYVVAQIYDVYIVKELPDDPSRDIRQA